MEVIDNAKQQTQNPGIILNYTRRTNPDVLTLPSKKVVSCIYQEVLQRTFLLLHPLDNWTSRRSKKYFCTPSVPFLTSSLRLKTLNHCYLKLFSMFPMWWLNYFFISYFSFSSLCSLFLIITARTLGKMVLCKATADLYSTSVKPVASEVLYYHFVSIVETFSYLPLPNEMKYSDGKIIECRGRVLDRSTIIGAI